MKPEGFVVKLEPAGEHDTLFQYWGSFVVFWESVEITITIRILINFIF